MSLRGQEGAGFCRDAHSLYHIALCLQVAASAVRVAVDLLPHLHNKEEGLKASSRNRMDTFEQPRRRKAARGEGSARSACFTFVNLQCVGWGT